MVALTRTASLFLFFHHFKPVLSVLLAAICVSRFNRVSCELRFIAALTSRVTLTQRYPQCICVTMVTQQVWKYEEQATFIFIFGSSHIFVSCKSDFMQCYALPKYLYIIMLLIKKKERVTQKVTDYVFPPLDC